MADDSSKLQNLEMALKDIEAKPIPLPLRLLKKITNNFSDEIGRGGFGVVYKGVLGNGEIVAVKKLNFVPDNPGQFENEAGHLMKLKHQNIVRFLGYCCEAHSEFMEFNGQTHLVEAQEKLFCLEYMQNGSLEKYIQDASRGLDWNKRYGIIKGICCGLHYLHGENLLHLDLKPANILLSNEMVPKITDFGLSRLFSKEQSRIYTKNNNGTLGYMAREYLDRGLINKKSDIFSLGVIILEMITGHRDYPWTESTGTSREAFVKDVLEKWRQRLKESRTSALENDCCQQIERCIKLGLDCTQTDWTKRPTSEEIIMNLSTWDITNIRLENPSSNSTPPTNKPPPNNQSSGSRCSTYAGRENPIDNRTRLDSTGSRCSACNNTISAGTRFFTKDDKRYHELCYKEHFNLKCVVCNNFLPSDSNGKIEWRVRLPSGEKYCPSHDNNNAGAPSTYGGPERNGCSACNKPISAGIKFFTKDGKRYHEQCYKEHFNLKCVICNNFIPSDSNGRMKWGVRPSGEKYCLSHENAGTSSQGRS